METKMDANKISKIMDEYNAGKIDKAETSLRLITEAGCDAQACVAVFSIYSTRNEDKSDGK